MCLLPASEILPPQLSRTVIWQYEIYLEAVTQDNNGMIIKTTTFLQRYTSTDFFFLGISHAKYFKQRGYWTRLFYNIMPIKGFPWNLPSHTLKNQEKMYLKMYFFVFKTCLFPSLHSIARNPPADINALSHPWSCIQHSRVAYTSLLLSFEKTKLEYDILQFCHLSFETIY